jgi:hypothetical protein
MSLNPKQFPQVSPGGVWMHVEEDEEAHEHLRGMPSSVRPGDRDTTMAVRELPDTIEHEKPVQWMVSTSGAAGSPTFMQSGGVRTAQRGMIAAEAAVKRRVEGRDPQTGRRY